MCDTFAPVYVMCENSRESPVSEILELSGLSNHAMVKFTEIIFAYSEV